jgi:hypothetical protein
MNSPDSNVEMTFRWETRDGGAVSKSFDLGEMTDTPNGRFCFFDDDGVPRAILRAEELAALQQSADEAVLNR